MPNPTQSPAETKPQVGDRVRIIERHRTDSTKDWCAPGKIVTLTGVEQPYRDVGGPGWLTIFINGPDAGAWCRVEPVSPAAVSDLCDGDEVEINCRNGSLHHGKTGTVRNLNLETGCFDVLLEDGTQTGGYSKHLVRLIRPAPTEAARTGEAWEPKVGEMCEGEGAFTGMVRRGKLLSFDGAHYAELEQADGQHRTVHLASLRPLPQATAGYRATGTTVTTHASGNVVNEAKPKPCPDCKRESGHSLTCPEFDTWIRNGEPLSPSPADAEAMRMHEEALKPLRAEELRRAALSVSAVASAKVYDRVREKERDAADGTAARDAVARVYGKQAKKLKPKATVSHRTHAPPAFPEDAYLDAESCEP